MLQDCMEKKADLLNFWLIILQKISDGLQQWSMLNFELVVQLLGQLKLP